LGVLAYHIEKGHLDTEKPISYKSLVDAGVLSRVRNGVKLLGKGADKFMALKTPVSLEVNDASAEAIEAVKGTGGNLKVVYRTPLIMRSHLKPHKFHSYKQLKTPMPPPKKIKKLEILRRKGLEVEYPSAPWYTDNIEKIKQEFADKEDRIKNGENAQFLEHLPAKRLPTPDRVRVERKRLFVPFKLPKL